MYESTTPTLFQFQNLTGVDLHLCLPVCFILAEPAVAGEHVLLSMDGNHDLNTVQKPACPHALIGVTNHQTVYLTHQDSLMTDWKQHGTLHDPKSCCESSIVLNKINLLVQCQRCLLWRRQLGPSQSSSLSCCQRPPASSYLCPLSLHIVLQRLWSQSWLHWCCLSLLLCGSWHLQAEWQISETSKKADI